MSEYCKYHPEQPSCYSAGSELDSRDNKTDRKTNPFKDTFTHTPRRKGVIELSTPPPRRDITDVEVSQTPRRRDFRPVEERKRRRGIVELEPQERIRTITNQDDKQKQFTNPNYGNNIPTKELEILRRRYNKRLQAGKERAGELLKVGTHEVVESRNQHKYGHLTEAAYKNAYEGKRAAMKQLKKGGEYISELNDFEIVPEFSDYDYLALRDTKTGELVQAGRGSDTEFLSANKNIDQALRGKSITGRLKGGVNDWFVNTKFMLKQAHETGTYKRQDRDLVRFAEAFGQDVSEVRLAGHSKAAATAEHLGKKYGNKVYSFNPAVHPSNHSTTEVHPNTTIEHFGEEFDFVSGARNFHEIPDYMKVHRYTTTPGTELETLGRHDHSQAIPTPERIVNGNIIVKRNTKMKNRLGLLGGTGKEIGKKIGGINNAIMAVGAAAIEPEYTNKSERYYRSKVMMPIDLVKGVAEFEGVGALGVAGAKGIGRFTQGLAPGAAIGAYTDLLMLDQQDNVPLHNALAKVRHAIFGADAEPDPDATKPSKVITAFNKHFSKTRYAQDQAVLHAREVYDTEYDGDMDFDSFLGTYHDAEGYKLAKSIEQFGYDDSREHHLSTDEMKLAEAEYNLRQEVAEAVETYPLLEQLLASQGYDTANGQPTFDYSLAAIEDRKRIEDELRFGNEFDVSMGSSLNELTAFTREQAESAATGDAPRTTARRSTNQRTTPPETFTKNGKTYVEQP